jgi:LysM domain
MLKKFLLRGLSLAMAATVLLATASPSFADYRDPIVPVPGNLLVNPSFEQPFYKQCCQVNNEFVQFKPNSPIDEVQIPNGWNAWWREPDNSLDSRTPVSCDLPGVSKNFCTAFHRPEYRDAAFYVNRIHTGNSAQKMFTFWSIHEAGMYQRVTNVKAGQLLEFSAYLQGWSTNVPSGPVSQGQQSMNLRVGIDPFGGTDAFSPNIVWSPAGDSYDVFTRFSVQATAAGNAVTVFTSSRPIYPLIHVDVYTDDAALVVIGTGTAPVAGGSTTTTTTTAATGPVSPFPGTTVDKATGNILYVIQPGDTSWSIAQRFNTTLERLTTWNAATFPDIAIVRIGKTMIVGKVTK